MQEQCDKKRSPNVYKSCPKMISIEKWWIFTPLQKLPKNVGDLGSFNCCQRLQKIAQIPINRPIWSHCAGSKHHCAHNWCLTVNIGNDQWLDFYAVSHAATTSLSFAPTGISTIKSFLNGPSRSLFVNFWSFSNKHYKFYDKLAWKMCTQYTEMGFEPTSFRSWVSSRNN